MQTYVNTSLSSAPAKSRRAPDPVQRLLVVEDNELNRDMITRRLQRLGYDVAIAIDGRTAVAVAEAFQPHAVLMDISLPVMDGIDAGLAIRAAPSTRHIPIIGVSAHAMSGDRERALAAGFSEYETKPIDLKRLLRKITECTGLQPARQLG